MVNGHMTMTCKIMSTSPPRSFIDALFDFGDMFAIFVAMVFSGRREGITIPGFGLRFLLSINFLGVFISF